jgi:hypothetical protein
MPITTAINSLTVVVLVLCHTAESDGCAVRPGRAESHRVPGLQTVSAERPGGEQIEIVVVDESACVH